MKRINNAFFMDSETAVKYINTQTNVLRYSLEGAEMEIKGDYPGLTIQYRELQRPQLSAQTIMSREIINYN